MLQIPIALRHFTTKAGQETILQALNQIMVWYFLSIIKKNQRVQIKINRLNAYFDEAESNCVPSRAHRSSVAA